jgi:hypothetical protein
MTSFHLLSIKRKTTQRYRLGFHEKLLNLHHLKVATHTLFGVSDPNFKGDITAARNYRQY